MDSTNKIDWLQQQFDILTQKNEFLKQQLEESSQREESMKKLYDKLNETIHGKDLSFLEDCAMDQLKQAQAQHTIDIENLRSSKNEVIDRLEAQLKEANLEKLELELNLRTQQVMTERADLDVSNQIVEIKQSYEQELDTSQKENERLESELFSAKKQISKFENELLQRNSQLATAEKQNALKEKKLQEVDSMTSYINLRNLVDVVAKKDEQIAELTAKSQETSQIIVQTEKCDECPTLVQKLMHVTKICKKLKLKLEQTQIQKQKLTVDLERATLLMNQQRLEFSSKSYAATTQEEELKSEVKFLIDKLMDEKTVQRSRTTLNTVRRRPRSKNRNRLSETNENDCSVIVPNDISVINRLSSASYYSPERGFEFSY